MKTRFVTAALMILALSGRAHAQMSINSDQKDPYQQMLERQDNERKENERAYNDQMKRLKKQPAAQTNSDPWKGARSSSTDSSAAKR